MKAAAGPAQIQGPPRGAIVLGGAHGSLAIARSLGRRGVPVWVLTDDNRLAALSRFVARRLSWPGPGAAGAVGFLLDLGRRHDLDGWVLFAGSDEDVRFVAQNHATLGTVFTLTTPVWDQLRWACDKRSMNARADELGIAHPPTRYPRTSDDLAEIGLAFPVILKPTFREKRNAFVDAKAWRADDVRSLRARYDEAAALVRADQIMVQELIPGNGAAQFSYAAVWDRGTPIGSLVARRARQYPIEFGFTSTLVETIKLPEIEAIAERFLKSLDYNGLVEIEFKYDSRDGCYKILDVNTRAWTWIALGAAAGVDFPALQWRLAAGEKIAPLAARRGVRWLFASRDIAAATQEMLTGRLSPGDYIRSWRRSAASAVFAWDDPLPAVLDLPLVAARVASRWLLRRNRGAAGTLQSARLHS